MSEYSAEEWKYGDPEVLYATNYYSGTDIDVAGTEKFSLDIDLTEYTFAIVDVKFLGTDATDDLKLRLYKRGDSSWTGNEIMWKSELIVENPGTEKEYQYTIPREYGPGHYRFGMIRSGSTTSFDVKITSRKARIWVLKRNGW